MHQVAFFFRGYFWMRERGAGLEFYYAIGRRRVGLDFFLQYFELFEIRRVPAELKTS